MENEILVKEPVPTRIKNFVERHKVAIAVTATASVALALQIRTASKFNNYLIEKDLYDEYYEDPDEAFLTE
jgi:hypothetical protein